MMDFSIGNYWYLLLLLLLPVVAVLVFSFKKWKKAKKTLFAEAKFHQELYPKGNVFSKVFPVLYLLGFLFLVLAMVDFLSGKQEMKVQQKVNSVIFVLDVSNSMNAEDIEPTRLQQAKNILKNCIQQMHDDKIGIVVFAGDAQSIMPLTSDYSAAENYIDAIETNIIPKQGTDFLKAVDVAADKFKNVPNGARKIIMISDGEDNEGNEKAAISKAQKEGITINTIGVGTEEGAPIPMYMYGQLMGYKTDASDETVITKRQTEALMSIAYDTDGEYIDGNNLSTAVSKILTILQTQKGSSQTVIDTQSAVHYYQWFLGISVLFFILIFMLNPKNDLNI